MLSKLLINDLKGNKLFEIRNGKFFQNDIEVLNNEIGSYNADLINGTFDQLNLNGIRVKIKEANTKIINAVVGDSINSPNALSFLLGIQYFDKIEKDSLAKIKELELQLDNVRIIKVNKEFSEFFNELAKKTLWNILWNIYFLIFTITAIIAVNILNPISNKYFNADKIPFEQLLFYKISLNLGLSTIIFFLLKNIRVGIYNRYVFLQKVTIIKTYEFFAKTIPLQTHNSGILAEIYKLVANVLFQTNDINIGTKESDHAVVDKLMEVVSKKGS